MSDNRIQRLKATLVEARAHIVLNAQSLQSPVVRRIIREIDDTLKEPDGVVAEQ